MNFPIQHETAAQLIARYGPRRTGPFTKLRPHAEFIQELRLNHASYDTIVAILRERHGIETSDTTVRKFCRVVLKEPPPKRRGKRPSQTALPTISPRPAPKPQLDGSQIAEVEFTDET
ncbi:MAG TPA: hypothetical protein VMA13_08730 [Candidatus Saccharimonadales bacterium]|nr:hypothetical protein [Candidatus Saccharimonadales bacterium]